MAQSQRKRSKPKNQNSTTSPSFVFDGTDCDGRNVYLPPGRWEWKILMPHPSMDGYREEVKFTALDPDVICFEEDNDEIEIHATYNLGRGIDSGKFLWVPIHYFKQDTGKVVTAYWVDEIRPKVTKVRWRKPRQK